ncbi:MAG TPA: TlpA disulfide reductase family protein [Burkholderiales bacterium]|nr:TlpA disulfide reductase family protein [Burkholderiales bacterium]
MQKLVRAFCITALTIATNQATAALPMSGKNAPDFALRSAAGGNLRLSEYRGQVVMVNFWATWCGPCRQELPLLNKMYERYRQAGFTVLAVNIEEDTGLAKKMAQTLGLSFPILFDNEKRVSKLYDPPAMPTTVLIDRNGRVRYQHLGYKPGYDAIYEKEIKELLRE